MDRKRFLMSIPQLETGRRAHVGPRAKPPYSNGRAGGDTTNWPGIAGFPLRRIPSWRSRHRTNYKTLDPTRCGMSQRVAFNLREWIDQNRSLLKPPVGNKIVWEDTDFMVMVVGGPNQRKDFHVNPTEEFYYQVEGNIQLKLIENGVHRTVDIREGDIFLLPPQTPHSPQRPAGTVGMVIERRRPEGDHDPRPAGIARNAARFCTTRTSN